MIIVTGGAGFIGSNIVKWLNKSGCDDILIVDNLKNSQKHRNLNSLEFYDYIDKNDFISNLDKFDNIEAIFHQGACSSTTESDGVYMMKNNYEYSKILLSFAVRQGAQFIYASSASVYGNGKKGFYEHRSCENPLNIYAYSKFLFDQWVRKHIDEFDIQVVGLRYFNVYGPQENHKGDMASVAFKFFQQILRNEPLKLFEGSEKFLRDFIYVNDIVKINEFFYLHKEKKGIFNAGCGKARSFLDIAKIIQSIYANVEIEYIPFPEKLKGKYQEFTEADLQQLRSIGYTDGFYSLEDGIKDYFKILDENNGFLTYS
jgi:ADP-L-glycero-D-manno-heptose 6-epimerase